MQWYTIMAGLDIKGFRIDRTCDWCFRLSCSLVYNRAWYLESKSLWINMEYMIPFEICYFFSDNSILKCQFHIKNRLNQSQWNGVHPIYQIILQYIVLLNHVDQQCLVSHIKVVLLWYRFKILIIRKYLYNSSFRQLYRKMVLNKFKVKLYVEQ